MLSNEKKVMILGGCGFIGSRLADHFVRDGFAVTVLDGILPRSGARKENLAGLLSRVHFIESKIENFQNLSQLLDEHSVIIDCMGWTCHRLALADPGYDLSLNVFSHLHWLQRVPSGSDKRVIYLGSRGQYGNPPISVITEEIPMLPEDIQGIHKQVAESYFRVFSKLKGFSAISLRFPNCVGRNQPFAGEDIGLVGGFIRDLMENKQVELYGSGRQRPLVYVEDLAAVVATLVQLPLKGFHAFNVQGHDVVLEDLLKKLKALIGRGGYVSKEFPHEIKAIDVGNAAFNDDKLRKLIGEVPVTGLDEILATTVKYFKENIK